MKGQFVADIGGNDQVESLFLVKNKNQAVGKTGKLFLTVILMDKTGELEGRVWDDAEKVSACFDTDDFVSVKGRTTEYMGKIQLKISAINKIDDVNVNVADFLPASEQEPEEMFADLRDIVETMKDPNLAALAASLLDDPEIAADYKRAPAAKGMHHVYIGGLLEHVLSLCRLIDLVCGHYGEKVNRDILITSAIAHDIGKTKELFYKRAFGYTDEGRLLGHITIGVEMVDEKIRHIEGFPQELTVLVKHMILSHHGQYEYGSPKRPKTLEATILSYLDDLDAKVNSIQSLIENDHNNGSSWTGFHRLFERYIYKENFLYQPEEGAGEAKEADEKSDEEKPTEGKTLTLFNS